MPLADLTMRITCDGVRGRRRTLAPNSCPRPRAGGLRVRAMGNPADRRIGLDSDAVAAASKRVGSHGDDVRASHSATKAALDDGLYGCVGNSGEELSRLSQ